MDFLDPKKRRAHSIRLFIGYGLVGLALLIGTGIISLYAYGFDFNRKTGTIVQNGLMFVDAHPESADIYLNGKSNGKTSSRLVLAEGSYSVELRRTGYRNWNKQINLVGGQIERLVYPFLFPEKLVSKDVQLYASQPGLATESPDRHWLIIQKPASLTDFDVYDLLTTTNNPAALTLPANLLTTTGPNHHLELSEWSTDNRHLVVRHTYNGGTEYILIDKDAPASSQNLTKLFNIPAAQITLHDKKYDQYYLYDPTNLSLATVDLKTHTPTVIINKVLAFKPHSADTILFVTPDGAPNGKVLVRLRSGTDTYTLREITNGAAYLVDVARFSDHWYMAAGSSAEGRVYLFKDPVDTIKKHDPANPFAPFALLHLDNPQFVSFSANTRFISVQAGAKFVVYDLEESRLLRFDTKLNIPLTQKATWMDGHRLTAISDGTLQVFEFDGTNAQGLNKADPSFTPFFDRDYKALFTVSPSVVVPGRPALVRTELKVTP